MPAGAVEGGDDEDAGDGSGQGEAFTADITEVVLTSLDETVTKLVVEWWTPTAGRRRIERE